MQPVQVYRTQLRENNVLYIKEITTDETLKRYNCEIQKTRIKAHSKILLVSVLKLNPEDRKP